MDIADLILRADELAARDFSALCARYPDVAVARCSARMSDDLLALCCALSWQAARTVLRDCPERLRPATRELARSWLERAGKLRGEWAALALGRVAKGCESARTE